MSGICGIVNLDGAPADVHTIREMAHAASHRGPDGIHYWHDGPAALAHLALDLSPEDEREHQPLVDHKSGLVVVADARIDNRKELAGQLAAGGYLQERDPTDAELILAAYRYWGEVCASRLIGDFAFAVWDSRERRLFAARDAMAMRAFYYRIESSRVLFGTEAKQILAAPGVEPRLFEPAVGAHLAGPFGLPEWSFYEGILQLAPAHALVVDEGGHRTWRYWDVDPEDHIRYRDEEEYIEHFLEIFSEAVRCRLQSTKPVGLFLSGGVDSGTIASTAGWLMQQEGGVAPAGFRAYSWAFEELPECDERHISGGIARHYGFPVTEVAADEAWPLKDYPAHGPDLDGPQIWVYQALIERTLSAARSEGMGMVFSGNRGDEMVGDWVFDHLGLLRAGRLRTLWEELQEQSRWSGLPLSRVAKRHLLKPVLLTLWPQGRAERLRQGLRHPRYQYPDWVRPEFAQRIGLDEIIELSEPQPTMKGTARRIRYKRIFSFAISRLILLDERTRARFGLNFADPWSDRRLAEFVLAVPQWRIQRAREPKRIARQAMRGVMPEKARRSAGKIEPWSLFDRGFKEQAKSTVEDLMTDSQASARGYLDEGALGRHYLSFLRDEPQPFDFWWALTLEMWLRRYWS